MTKMACMRWFETKKESGRKLNRERDVNEAFEMEVGWTPDWSTGSNETEDGPQEDKEEVERRISGEMDTHCSKQEIGNPNYEESRFASLKTISKTVNTRSLIEINVD